MIEPKLSPQAKYNREVRRDPLVREIESERQRARRARPEVKAKTSAYWQQRKERTS